MPISIVGWLKKIEKKLQSLYILSYKTDEIIKAQEETTEAIEDMKNMIEYYFDFNVSFDIWKTLQQNNFDNKEKKFNISSKTKKSLIETMNELGYNEDMTKIEEDDES